MTAQTNKQIAYRCLNQYADSPPPGGYLLDVIRDAERIEEALNAKDAALLEADKNGYERGRREGIEEAAKEVETHWNSSDQMTNQKAQALRSAAVIRSLKEPQ